MPNPFNPLDWVKSAQDWFVKTERSSGFRPYLIYQIICFGMGLTLLTWFRGIDEIKYLAWLLVGGPTIGFLLLYGIKAFQEPDFCRSETHIQTMKKYEIEMLGTETHVYDAEVIEKMLNEQGVPDVQQLSPPEQGGDNND